MLPSPLKIVVCPNCQTPYIMGGHDYFSEHDTIWSDGHREEAWSPDMVAQCDECQAIFIAAAQIKKGMGTHDFKDRKLKAVRQHVSLETLQQIIANPTLVHELTEQRLYLYKIGYYRSKSKPPDAIGELIEKDVQKCMLALKTNALFKINDLRRQKKCIPGNLESLFQTYAGEVVANTEETDDWAIIQKAEWCRNLGRFKETFRLLKQVHDHELKKLKRKLFLAAFFRNRKLFLVQRNPQDGKSLFKRLWTRFKKI